MLSCSSRTFSAIFLQRTKVLHTHVKPNPIKIKTMPAAPSKRNNDASPPPVNIANHSLVPSISKPVSNVWDLRKAAFLAKISAPKPSPAVPAVLQIVELLEQILLRLDMKTLLLAQRVHPQWKAVIAKSALLQKKLFLMPATRRELAKLNLVEEDSYADIDREDLVVTKNVWKPDTQTPPGRIKPQDCGFIVYNPLLLRQRPIVRNGERLLQLRQMPKFGAGCRPHAYNTEINMKSSSSSSSSTVTKEEQHHSETLGPDGKVLSETSTTTTTTTTTTIVTTTTTITTPSWQKMFLAQPQAEAAYIGFDLRDVYPEKIWVGQRVVRCYVNSYLELERFLGDVEKWLYERSGGMKEMAEAYPVLFGRDGEWNTMSVIVLRREAGKGKVEELLYG